ncbi:MAG: hypothetical protein QNK36_02640 [Colwellia sp.]|nr:hypothetical protein [Colwellia sp.]
MESISTINTVTPPIDKKYSREEILPTIDIQPSKKQSNTLLTSKFLQPDQVEISEASRKKSSEAQEKSLQKLADTTDKVMTKEETAATSKATEGDIDKEIRELSMEILEITVQIEMLNGKEDKESIKERQALEVELAMKKGALEATISRKLQMATLS